MCGPTRKSFTYHEECRSGGDNASIPLNILGALAGKADWDDSPESQNLLHQCRDVGNLLLNQAFIPGITIGIHFHDLVVRFLLDALAILGGQVGNAHDQITRNGVKTRGNHGQANRFHLSWDSLVSTFKELKRSAKLCKFTV